MSQSIFHVNHSDPTLNNETQNCNEAISAFNFFSHQYDGAGSHLLQSIAQAMRGTPYQNIADECVTNFNEVFVARQSLKFFEQFKSMEAELITLKGHIDAGNHKDLSKIYAQTFFHLLLQFVKMHDNYFKVCHEKIARIISVLTHQNEDETSSTGPVDGHPTCDNPSKQNTAATKNSPKMANYSPKHQSQTTLKSSFFSLFERKSVPREKQSAFYVDVQEESVDDSGSISQQPPTITCDDTSAHGAASSTNIITSSSIPNNVVPVDLASEEELNSVINLLSGVGCQSSNTTTMHVIPENQIQLTVPQLYSRMPSPASDSHIEELKPPHFQMHRRSEGSLDLSFMHKNIWNSPHRSSAPSISLRPVVDNINIGGAVNRRYSYDMNTPFRSNSPYVPAQTQLWPGSQWLAPSNNNTWPYYNTAINPGRCETMNSSWSGVQDSSDLSDDSSCGEQFFAVGQDLVQALDSKDHSSDDDGKGKGDKSYNGEKKSINTWPTPQLWDKSTTGEHDGDLPPPTPPDDDHMIHRPLQMQWSDPMSTHSRWPSNPPGVHQQKHSQSMQGFSLYQ